jgi:diguanylate cyclase (GGDEF)-like protein/PAS domain S-box-containing protein
MADPLRTLVAAGDVDIAGGLVRTLHAAGIDGTRRAADRVALEEELRAGCDLIVCAGRDGDLAAPAIVPLARAVDPDVAIVVVGEGADGAPAGHGVLNVASDEAPGGLADLIRRELETARSRRAARDAAGAAHLRERALEAATSGIAVVDARHPDMRLVYVNRAFARLFGWQRAELIGRSPAVLAGEATGIEARRDLAAAMRAGRDHEATILTYRRDGTTAWSRVNLTPARDEAGAVVEWIAVVDDVTEGVEALDRLAAAEDRQGMLLRDLEEAESRYRCLVEQIPAVTYVADWAEVPDLRYVSPQIEELLGWPPEAFIADQELWYRCVHPEDRDRLRAEERRVFRAVERFDLEYRMIARDGREVWVWEKDAPIRDDAGAPLFSQGVVVDITSLRRTELELREERDRAQRYLDVAGAIIVVLDPDERVALLNRAGHEVLGYADGELLGRNWFDAVVPDGERESARRAFDRLISGETSAAGDAQERTLLTKEGELRTVAWHDTVLRDDAGRVTAALSSGVDTTERREAEQQIAYLAYHDPLTGLPNRALLQEHLELAMARARRHGHAVALLYLDLDDFKLVNDSLGHPAGDELLCHIALRLGERRRGMDLLARQGGDEFLLLLADLDRDEAEATARRVADSMLRALNHPFTISGAEFHVGASVGISIYPRDATDADQLLRHADASMYQAKAAGRNGVSLYTGDAHEPLERLSMTSRLRKALARGEFVLHWQPIVDPRDGTLHKLEALIRWEDPFRGLVLPGDFIEFAEDTGLIDRVGDWVLEAVVDQLGAWDGAGLHVPQVTVNVSPRQLRRPDFAQRLRAHVERIAPRSLTVEITESAAMADPARTEPALDELHAAGVEIAIDDFGAGYSSLTRLRALPVQVLKIDRTFLRGVPEDPEATAIVTAMIELAGALGMEAVAEGVETEAQRAFLIERGCPLAQGFLLGRPAPAREIEALLGRAAEPVRPPVAPS